MKLFVATVAVSTHLAKPSGTPYATKSGTPCIKCIPAPCMYTVILSLHIVSPNDGGEEVCSLEALEIAGDEKGADKDEAGHQEGVGHVVATHGLVT